MGKRKEITGAEVRALLNQIGDMRAAIESANEAFNNHIPDADIYEHDESDSLALASQLISFALRIQGVRKVNDMRKETAALKAARQAAAG